MSQHDEAIEMQFRRPDSVVVSVRLNAKESRILTAEARRAGEKLSTFIKRLAFEAIDARHREREARTAIGGEASGQFIIFTGKTTTWPPTASSAADDAPPSSWEPTARSGAVSA